MKLDAMLSSSPPGSPAPETHKVLTTSAKVVDTNPTPKPAVPPCQVSLGSAHTSGSCDSTPLRLAASDNILVSLTRPHPTEEVYQEQLDIDRELKAKEDELLELERSGREYKAMQKFRRLQAAVDAWTSQLDGEFEEWRSARDKVAEAQAILDVVTEEHQMWQAEFDLVKERHEKWQSSMCSHSSPALLLKDKCDMSEF